jgi:hypothetical protein
MADRKITDLTALAAGSQATGDLLTIVDVSEAAAADKNKKMTMENLFKGIPGDVGIGTSSPAVDLHVASTNARFRIENTGSSIAAVELIPGGETNPLYIYADATRNLIFQDHSSERMRIDSSGRLLLGSTTARANFFNSTVAPQFQLEGSGDFDRQAAIISSSSTGARGSVLILGHQKSGANGGNTASAANDSVGVLSFQGNDGTQFVECARIAGDIDNATPGANDMPGALKFLTTSDGGTSPTERLRIDSSGNVGINVTSPDRKLEVVDTNSNGSYPLAVSNFINATANKGAAIDFRLTTGGNTRGELGCKWNSNSSSDGTHFYFAPNDGTTGNIQKLRIDNDGLKFGSDTAATNALDDYEEGNWTPAMHSGGWTGFGVASAKYVKIGALVFVQCYVHGLTGSGTSNVLELSGLPYTSVSNGYAAGSVDIGEGSVKGVYARTESSSNKISFFYPSEGVTSSRISLKGNQIGDAYIIIGLTYFTSS